MTDLTPKKWIVSAPCVEDITIKALEKNTQLAAFMSKPYEATSSPNPPPSTLFSVRRSVRDSTKQWLLFSAAEPGSPVNDDVVMKKLLIPELLVCLFKMTSPRQQCFCCRMTPGMNISTWVVVPRSHNQGARRNGEGGGLIDLKGVWQSILQSLPLSIWVFNRF